MILLGSTVNFQGCMEHEILPIGLVLAMELALEIDT